MNKGVGCNTVFMAQKPMKYIKKPAKTLCCRVLKTNLSQLKQREFIESLQKTFGVLTNSQEKFNCKTSKRTEIKEPTNLVGRK